MARSVDVFFEESDLYIQVDKLADQAAPTVFLETLVGGCTGKVFGSDGVQIGGDVTMSFVAGSDGLWRGTIPDTVAVAPGDLVTLEIVADDGAGKKKTWHWQARVQYDQ